jgi:hypothetical protein
VEAVRVVVVVLVWRTVVFGVFGLSEVLAWMALGSFRIVAAPPDPWAIIRPFMVAFVWAYTVYRPITTPTTTVPYDLFIVYLMQIISGILDFGSALYGHSVLGLPSPSRLEVIGQLFNIFAIVVLLMVVVEMPMAIPSAGVDKTKIVRNPFLCHCMLF